MFALKETTKRNIEKTVGIPFQEIVGLDAEDEIKVAIFSTKRDPRKIGRGNPLLSRRRIRTIETVDSRLTEIVNEAAKRRGK